MSFRRSLRLTAILAVIAVAPACTIYQPRPVTFKVRDWDTGEPVKDAEVKIHYLVMMDFGVLFASIGPTEGVTDQNGNLTLIIDPEHRAFSLMVSSDAYPEDHSADRAFCDPPRWARLTRGPWHSIRDEYDVRLIRGPRPIADVTFPIGYRGAVVVKFGPENTPTVVPGKREFSYTASARGLVEIKESALFLSAGTYDRIRARFVDGTTIPTVDWDGRQPPPPGCPPDALALRFVAPSWKDHVWLYVIGTAAEAETMRRQVWPDNNTFDEAAFKRIVESRK